MIKFLVLLILFQVQAFASYREEAVALLQRFNDQNETIQRMESMSEIFLGFPYGDGGPLGEGSTGRYDQDPLYRFDTFDCTTYVETIISLALSRDVDEFETQMDQIRYEHGDVDYLKRNHFPSLQWIPFNVENGLLKEINHLIAGAEAMKMASTMINLPGWLRAIKIAEIKIPAASEAQKQSILSELQARAVDFVSMYATLQYVPFHYFLDHPKHLDAIPHGSVVNFVRPSWDLTQSAGTHMNVSHQGLLFRRDGVLYLRHASTSAGKIVEEIPLLDYLKKFKDHPTMKGVHFMAVN